MNQLSSRLGGWVVWLLPFALIAALIGWETDWGRALTPVPALESTAPPQAVNVALMPDYRIDGGLAERRETVERTLFNPTRRPAPPQAVAATRSSLQRGQFVLTGTTVVEQKATAFLREVNGGRARRVQKGDTINGMTVSDVHADRIKLTMGEESEELTLKLATGPRVTVQPMVPVSALPGAPAAGAPGQPPQQPPQQAAQAPATPPAPGAQAPVQDVAEVLANRRRAARAAEAAAAAQNSQQAQPVQPAPQAQPAQATPQPSDPAWGELYQRYQQPRR